jgi:hypothetical protein
MAENLSDSLQWHAFALGVEEDDEQPANKTHSGVKSKAPLGVQFFIIDRKVEAIMMLVLQHVTVFFKNVSIKRGKLGASYYIPASFPVL